MNHGKQSGSGSGKSTFLIATLAAGVAMLIPLLIFGIRGGTLFTMPGQPAQVVLLPENWYMMIYSRLSSGLQRADDVAFFGNGTRIAMTCPRYTKFTVWQFGYTQQPKLLKTVDLLGRPQKLVPFDDKLFILQRPPGDDRHIKPGFFEVFDRDANPISSPVDIGWDPDDMAVVERDGKIYGLILLSGNAEGEDNRPNPSVKIVEIDPKTYTIREVSESEIPDAKQNDEDPLRIVAGTFADTNDKTEHVAMITLGRHGAVRKINWTTPEKPTWESYWNLSDAEPLGASLDITQKLLLTSNSLTGDVYQFPVDSRNDVTIQYSSPFRWSALATIPNHNPRNPLPKELFPVNLAAISETNSSVSLMGPKTSTSFKLHGPYGFGSVRPMAVSVYRENLEYVNIAVCDRTGGLHLIVLQRSQGAAPTLPQAAAPAVSTETAPTEPTKETSKTDKP